MKAVSYKPDDRLREYNQRVSRLINEDRSEYSFSAMSLISVIIPCYNQAHFLSEAIESVLAQSYSYLEIIVVDDGSTDDTAQIAAKYPGVRCIRQENQGLSTARNTGLRESRGEILVFLDADDLLLPHALETGLNYLLAHPECAFVYGHYHYVNEDGSIRNEFFQEPVEQNYYLVFLKGNHIGMHATVMYRRTALEAVGGFDPSLPACEDYDLYLRLARKYPIGRHDKLVAEYRQHGTNMSRNTALMLKTVLDVLRSQWKYAKTDKEYKKAYKIGVRSWQEFYGELLVIQLAGLRQRGEVKQTVRIAMTLLRYAPQYCIWHYVLFLLKPFMERGAALMKAVLPVFIYRLLAQWCGIDYYPSVNKVYFGDLRRINPISRDFGFERGTPIDRYYINNFLANYTADIHGHVLEVGGDAYTRKFGDDNVTSIDIFSDSGDNSQATIIGDLASADHIPSSTFDCIILTQTLQYIYDLRSAIRTLYRILKPGGVLLATVPGISQISADKWAESWCWSFSRLSIQRMFEEVFPAEGVTVEAHGNVFATTALLQGLAAEELCQQELDYHDWYYQLLITLRAVKIEEMSIRTK